MSRPDAEMFHEVFRRRPLTTGLVLTGPWDLMPGLPAEYERKTCTPVRVDFDPYQHLGEVETLTVQGPASSVRSYVRARLLARNILFPPTKGTE